MQFKLWFVIIGSSTAFRKLYEDAIVKSRQPDATAEERNVGEARAAELTKLTSQFVLRRTQEVNNSYLPPRGLTDKHFLQREIKVL